MSNAVYHTPSRQVVPLSLREKAFIFLRFTSELQYADGRGFDRLFQAERKVKARGKVPDLGRGWGMA